MRVLHLNTWDFYGGAAQGMFILHKELLCQGVDSLVLVQHQTINDESIVRFCGDAEALWRQGIDTLPIQFYPQKEIGLISPSVLDAPALLQKIKEINPDIVHMHWVFGGLLSVEDIGRIGKPIVWTIRDFAPFTGGCHHPLACDKYKNICGQCPILRSTEIFDITYQNLERKRKIYANEQISVVGISEWISRKAKESAAFRGLDIETIHNNIDTQIYYPLDKSKAKSSLGLATNKKIISIGAHSLMDEHKGLHYFFEALSMLHKESYLVLFFGQIDEVMLKSVPQEFVSFGYLHDKNILRNIYAVSDVFVAPSLLEPFGKTIGESMACGTPVVCFEECGGGAELIEHKEDGYLAKKFEPNDLVEGILWILKNGSRKDLSRRCAEKILSHFSPKESAKKYIDLYEKKKHQTFKKNTTIGESGNSLVSNFCKSKEMQKMFEKIEGLGSGVFMVYGYGFMAQVLEEIFPEKIKAFVDLDSKKIDNIKVFHPSHLKSLHFDKIIISVMRYEEQIRGCLMDELGVQKNKIVSLLNDA